MLLSKGTKLIKRMSSETTRDPTALITEKQVKFLHWIFNLEQLIDDVVYALVEEVNS